MTVHEISLLMRTAANPIIKGDVPDLSIIRVGDAYYMVSTTMYFCPVAPIMKSYDLVNWKIVSYCADIIDDLPNFRLETEDQDRIGDYGRGQWASSLRFYNNRYWVLFTNNTTNKSYLFSSANAERGNWDRFVYDRRFHDPSIFMDHDSGKMYIFHGYCDIWLTEMENDLSGVKSGGIDRLILPANGFTGCKGAEGSHAYKLNGFYYLFLIAFESGRRVELCYRASSFDGPWEGKKVLDKGLGGRTGGVAQGGIVETPDGDWYGFFFQDRDAVGRVPVLVPMRWDNELWPVFGDSSGNIPVEFKIRQTQDYEQNLYASDEFNSGKLQLAWQWNHNPDIDNWSLSERPGYLRLKTGRTSRTIFHARNTLTQRTFEPACEGIAALEPVNMKDGDKAGLVFLQAISGFVGIERESGKKYIVMYTCDNENNKGMNATETRQAKVEFTGSRIYLKISCRFRTDTNTAEKAAFSYSLDGINWQSIGIEINMRWTMTHFTGARFGLFNYATKTAGGYVDFDYFHMKLQFCRLKAEKL